MSRCLLMNLFGCSLLAAGLLANSSHAEIIRPLTYSMRNGQQGAFDYFDDSYDGERSAPKGQVVDIDA